MLTVTDNNNCTASFETTVPLAEGCVFDLALEKVLITQGPYIPGQDVTFTITIFNQGTVDAYNIAVADYIPTGLSFNAADNMTAPNNWTLNGSTAEHAISMIEAGESASITIVLEIDASAVGTTIINTAEVTAATDIDNMTRTDADSPLGTTHADGDTTGETDGNGGNSGSDIDDDEDDFDFASLTVCADISLNISSDVDKCSTKSAAITFTITGGSGTYDITYSDGITPTTIDDAEGRTTITVNPEVTTSYTVSAVEEATQCPVTIMDNEITVTVLEVSCTSFPWNGGTDSSTRLRSNKKNTKQLTSPTNSDSN